MTNGFDRLLRESLTAEAAADHGAECLDAALVAGWFDGTLSHAERTAVEAHAAACSRCQAMIAALVRTDRPSPRVWWRAPAVRWLVPVAVASAASLVVWIGVLRTSDVETPPAAASTSARLESPAPAPTPVPESATAARRVSPGDRPGGADAAARRRSPVSGGAAEKARAVSGRDSDAKATLSAGTIDIPPPPIEPLRQQAGIAAQLPQAPGPPTPNASPRPVPGARAGAVASPAAAPRASEPTTAPLTDAAGESRARSVAQSVGASAGRGGGRAPLILSPDRSVRWRISGSGQVERSANGGVTWQTQTTGVNAVLTAGIAPSSSVCWLVGWRGVVLKTSDGGQTWTRVAFPEEIDLLTVVADDDKVATVTAAGGRQLHTTDGGVSWK